MKSLLDSYDKGQITAAIGKELYASNLYKDIANKLQVLGYFGAQKYFLKESADELEHYQKWADYCNDRLDVATVPGVPAMNAKITSLMEAFMLALETEIELGEFYEKFYTETECEFTRQRLHEFLEIQRTSIGEYGDLVARLQIIGEEKSGLLIFDNSIA